jgi:hypothetical protein
MTRRHAIDQALDLARMPALARVTKAPPIPPDIIEIMKVAAASPQCCRAAVATTGEPEKVLIEAARFYLQQMLFRPDADSYRILGIEPTASRATARSHMRWLLQWLHPDRNRDLDAVYAERVLKAWREIGTTEESSARAPAAAGKPVSARERNGEIRSIRLPWIKFQSRRSRKTGRKSRRMFVVCAVPTGLAIICIVLWSAFHYFDLEPAAAIASFR